MALENEIETQRKPLGMQLEQLPYKLINIIIHILTKAPSVIAISIN